MMGKMGWLLAVLLVIITINVGCSNTSTTSGTNTYSIAGTVTSSGTGLQNVTVTLDSTTTATTDVSGNYIFSGLANGSYTITPSKTGYSFTPTSSTQTVNNANIIDVNFLTSSNTVIISGLTGTAGLTVTVRHPSDIDNSSPIVQTASTGTNGAFSLSVPYGSDFYLNYSGTAGITPYASVNSRIWRNITVTPDLSQETGEGLADITQAAVDNMLNNSMCGGTPCSTTGIAGKGWLCMDTDSSPTGSNHIGGVFFALNPTPVFFGYNNDSIGGNTLIAPPSLTETVTGTVNFQISSACGSFNTSTIVTVTASKSASANQTYEFPIVQGELTYKEVRY
jgi:hypothetical protein